jgi:hypothetical protein
MFFGEFAQDDAMDEARRCGGTARAFPLYKETEAASEESKRLRDALILVVEYLSPRLRDTPTSEGATRVLPALRAALERKP